MAGRKADRGSFRERHGALYWRGQLPEKTEDGEVIWRFCERSTKTLDLVKARSLVDAWRAEAYARLAKPIEKKPARGLVFAEAVFRYVKSGGKNKVYLLKILDEIGMIPILDVTQHIIDGLAEKLYPGRTSATLNRHVYTPICAVLNTMASKEYTPPRIRRPKGHLAPSNFQRPPKDWFQRVLPECAPNLATFLLFCRLHGRRTSEACSITPADIDVDAWRVTVRDTKADQVIRIKPAAPVIEQLGRYPWRINQYVFGQLAFILGLTAASALRVSLPVNCPPLKGVRTRSPALR
jgi:integrase